MTIYVQLGNPAPKNSFAQPEGNDQACECCAKTDVRHEAVTGPEVTTWSVPSSERGEPGYYSLLDCVRSITAPDGAWANHTWGTPDPSPLWVASNSPSLEMVLAEHFGCPAGWPDDFVAASGVDAPVVAADGSDPLAEPAPPADPTPGG